MTTENKCGTCTACCRVYAIPELNKRAGPWCTHCDVGKGCKIYDGRPKLCVDFKCLWLQSHEQPKPMADELRPDRCKVVFSPVMNDDMSTAGEMTAAITMPNSSDAWRKGAARKLIDTMVRNGLRVIIGPPGTTTKTLVDRRGEREVKMTEPDENGMQWSIPDKESM